MDPINTGETQEKINNLNQTVADANTAFSDVISSLHQTQQQLAQTGLSIAELRSPIIKSISSIISQTNTTRQQIEEQRKAVLQSRASQSSVRSLIATSQAEQQSKEQAVRDAQDRVAQQQALKTWADKEVQQAYMRSSDDAASQRTLKIARETAAEAAKSLAQSERELAAAQKESSAAAKVAQDAQSKLLQETGRETELVSKLNSSIANLVNQGIIPDDLIDFAGSATLVKALAQTSAKVTDAQDSFKSVSDETRRAKASFALFSKSMSDLNSAFSQLQSPVASSIIHYFTSNATMKRQIELDKQRLAELEAEQSMVATQQDQAKQLISLYENRIQSLQHEVDEAELQASLANSQQASLEAELAQRQSLAAQIENEINQLIASGASHETLVAATTRSYAALEAVTDTQTRLAEATKDREDAERTLTDAQVTHASQMGPLTEKLQEQTRESGALARKQKTLAEEYAQQQLELKNAPTKLLANRLSGAARVLDAMSKALEDMVKEVRKTQQAFGISANNAVTLKFENFKTSVKSFTDTVMSLGKTAGVSAEEILATQQSFQSEFGGVITSEAAEALTRQAIDMGVTTEQLAVARRQFMTVTGGSLTDATAQQDKFIDAFKSKGLTAKDALDAISKNSEIFARNGTRFAASFARAAAEAKKIGVDLGKIDQVGDNIIGDFEGFLEKQAELGAMGFNFDSSRLAEIAESGDTGALMGELRSQLAAQGKDLNNLRRSEQLALSQAFGIPMAELLRLTQEETKGKESASGEKTVDVAAESNASLKQLVNMMGALEKVFGAVSSVLKVVVTGLLGKIAFNTAVMAYRKPGATLGDILTGGKGGGGTSSISPPTTSPAGGPPLPPGGGPGSVADQAAPRDPNRLIKGAVAMVIMAGALYVFAKALQEFSGGKVDWTAVGMAMTSLAGLTAAIVTLSKFMGSGDIIKGAIGMAIMSSAMIPLAKALQMFVGLDFKNLAVAGGALIGLAIAFKIIAPMMQSLVNPVIIAGLGIFVLSMMGLGKAMQYAAPFVSALGDVLAGFAPIVQAVGATIVGIFAELGKMSALQIIAIAGSLSIMAYGIGSLGAIGLVSSVGIGLAAFAIGRLAKHAEKVQILSSSLAQLKNSIVDLQNVDTDKLKEIGAAVPKATGRESATVVTTARTAVAVATVPPPATLPPVPKIDTAALEKKLDNVVVAISQMKVELDGVKVGRVLARTSTNTNIVAALGGP